MKIVATEQQYFCSPDSSVIRKHILDTAYYSSGAACLTVRLKDYAFWLSCSSYTLQAVLKQAWSHTTAVRMAQQLITAVLKAQITWFKVPFVLSI